MWLAFKHLNFIKIVQIIIGLELALVFPKLAHDSPLVDGLRAHELSLGKLAVLWIYKLFAVA